MARKALFRDPVRFSLTLESSVVAQLDKMAQLHGIERSRLITRLITKYIDDPNPFGQTSSEAAQMVDTIRHAAEDPGKYGEPAPDTATRLPTADDTIPGAKSAG